ncbi:copine-8-like [Planoprotostelium fungivorum]|uniref:non-specific protein-tyrosine kinase n=1 Tax=Planoprotostelium fungivorum TaxID=1890364 RepID=A0A2P6N769_9EUKA|nr:copine-8-like [Planoprotostelium fungivorum]
MKKRATFRPPTLSRFSSVVVRLQLSIRCEHLHKKAMLANDSPIVILSWKSHPESPWEEYGRTERVKNNLNPAFGTAICIDWFFDRIQRVKFEVFSSEGEGDASRGHLLGCMECHLSDIVTSPNRVLKASLRKPSRPDRSRGIIIIASEQLKSDQGQAIQFRIEGRDLDKKDLFGKSDPYLLITKRHPQSEQFDPVYRTETIKNTLDPNWRPFETTLQNLCNNDTKRELEFQIWDWNRSTDHRQIGYFRTSIETLLERGKGAQFALMNDTLREKKEGYKHSGIITIDAELCLNSTFLQYILGGCEFELIVAIDCSISKESRLGEMGVDKCQEAIAAVGSVLADYDSDNLYPVYGFGAEISEDRQSCFALNGDELNPEVADLEGVIGCYQRARDTYRPGPVNFAPVIKVAANIASRRTTQEVQRYHILLIITEGKIEDLQSAIDVLVKTERLPLSVVIVGLGDGNFHDMQQLDGDDEPLIASNGAIMARDIVQFVDYKCHAGDLESLAKTTLAEIPGQLLSYMNDRGIKPNAAINRPEVLFQRRPVLTHSHSLSLLPALRNTVQTDSPSGSRSTFSKRSHSSSTSSLSSVSSTSSHSTNRADSPDAVDANNQLLSLYYTPYSKPEEPKVSFESKTRAELKPIRPAALSQNSLMRSDYMTTAQLCAKINLEVMEGLQSMKEVIEFSTTNQLIQITMNNLIKHPRDYNEDVMIGLQRNLTNFLKELQECKVNGISDRKRTKLERSNFLVHQSLENLKKSFIRTPAGSFLRMSTSVDVLPVKSRSKYITKKGPQEMSPTCYTTQTESNPPPAETITVEVENEGGQFLQLMIEDEDGKQFWSSVFGLDNFYVTHEDFIEGLNVEAMFDLDSDEQKALLYVLDYSNTGNISQHKFSEFLKSFGPVEASINNMRNILSCPWFCGFISKSETDHLLYNQPVGTFLVRFSATNAGAFAIAYVSTNGVAQILISSDKMSGVVVKEQDFERYFPSIFELIDYYKSILTIPYDNILPFESFYEGDMSRTEAEEALGQQAAGTFIARFSSNNMGSIALSWTQADGTINHELLHMSSQGGYYRFNTGPTPEEKSVRDIVRDHAEALEFSLKDRLKRQGKKTTTDALQVIVRWKEELKSQKQDDAVADEDVRVSLSEPEEIPITPRSEDTVRSPSPIPKGSTLSPSSPRRGARRGESRNSVVLISNQMVNDTEVKLRIMLDKNKVVYYKELEDMKKVGGGQYGEVYRALWRGKEVAVKQLRQKMSVTQMREFLQEATIFEGLPNHPFLGTTINPFTIVTEYCALGSLERYLLFHSADITTDMKRRFILETSRAMTHLHASNIVHRDLAARNLLLTSNYVVKVSDFGLSRTQSETVDSDVGSTTDVIRGAFKWMSPEAFKHNRINRKSDVFSFGITAWEIIACCQPYPDYEPIAAAVEVASAGLRPDLSIVREPFLSELMQRCWHQDPSERPEFVEIESILNSEIDFGSRSREGASKK